MILVLPQWALTTHEHVLGPDHSLTRETRTHLQAVLAELGQTPEAAAVEAAHPQEGRAAEQNQVSEA